MLGKILEKKIQVNFASQQCVLQFTPKNSVSRKIAALLPSYLPVWSPQKCVNTHVLYTQISALLASLLHD
jgi:hypothetical protein